MKKVVFVIPSLTDGGAEKNFIWLANNLIKDFKVIFITLTNKKKLQEDELSSEIKLIQLNKSHSLLSLWSCRKEIQKIKPDIVISTIVSANFIISVIKILSTHKFKTITRVSTSVENFKKTKATFIKNFFYFFVSINLSNTIVALSDNSYEEISRYKLKRSSSKIILIENPIRKLSTETSQVLETILKNNKGSYNIVTFGRIEKGKNIEFLIKSVIQLREEIDTTLTIVGAGALESQLNEEYKDHSKYIFFTGYLNQFFGSLKKYDLYINASTFEGSSNAILEALYLKLDTLVSQKIYTTLPKKVREEVNIYNHLDTESINRKILEIHSGINNEKGIQEPLGSNEENILLQWKNVVDGT